ncbi:glutaredoxin family protein [Ureibacillus thermosphaericus]|uniref:glutaredoxin family protein n=1 Tax=Ureibacillus thermosphaericus TaxID=51173 RepID=UPI000BBCDD22|nr:glutaredoxin family protein [Ureibacillus thermosphaericus]
MKNVIVYTTNSCPYCVMVKNFLNQQRIPFEEINVEAKPELMLELVNKTGQMGVPQIEIDGQWIVGFNPNAIMNEAGTKLASR